MDSVRPPAVAGLQDGLTYHFVGIGGYGMSGLAHILLAAGFHVTGSDARASERLERLRAMGARVAVGHDAANVAGAGMVVYSTDVPKDNVELVEARRCGLPLRHRSELLAAVLNPNDGIAVTGTHGKTTTTAMVGQVLVRGGLDPTVLVGGEVDALGGNARLGRGSWIVAEACESDGSFLRYRPRIAIITNIEPEHLDHYGGRFDHVVDAFGRFAANTQPGGALVLCADDPLVRELGHDLPVSRLTYGRDARADLRFSDLRRDGAQVRFTVLEGRRRQGEITLQVPGLHNVMNALAAVAVGRMLEVSMADIASSLEAFRGAHRRFEVLGGCDGILVVDDYAHHPTEIRATLRAARERAGRRVIAVFQPQRYARTHLLMTDFSQAFHDADEIVLTDIYSPPGDRPIPGVNSAVLARMIEEREHRPVRLISDPDDIVDYLAGIAASGDMVLTMGAGDIWKVARRLVERLEKAGQAS